MCLPKGKGGMGFHGLKCFNVALLAKQSWRLLEGTNPLLLKILKVRYFKNTSMLEAHRGYDPRIQPELYIEKYLECQIPPY